MNGILWYVRADILHRKRLDRKRSAGARITGPPLYIHENDMRLHNLLIRQLLRKLVPEPGGTVHLPYLVMIRNPGEKVMTLRWIIAPFRPLLPLKIDVSLLFVLRHILKKSS